MHAFSETMRFLNTPGDWQHVAAVSTCFRAQLLSPDSWADLQLPDMIHLRSCRCRRLCTASVLRCLQARGPRRPLFVHITPPTGHVLQPAHYRLRFDFCPQVGTAIWTSTRGIDVACSFKVCYAQARHDTCIAVGFTSEADAATNCVDFLAGYPANGTFEYFQLDGSCIRLYGATGTLLSQIPNPVPMSAFRQRRTLTVIRSPVVYGKQAVLR